MKYILFVLKTSFDNLKRNRVKTFLTSCGILIGIASVILLAGIGLGFKEYIGRQFQNLGTNLVIVFPGKVIGQGGIRPGGGALGGTKFDEQDVLNLKKIKEQELVVPVVVKTVTIEGNKKSQTSDLFASSQEIFSMRNLKAQTGSLFTNSDVEKKSKKIVLGAKVAEDIFGNSKAAVGKTVRIANQGFEVWGVLEKKGGGGFGGPDFDSFTYAPYKSIVSLNPDKKFVAIYVKAKNEQSIPVLKKNIEKLLLRRYKVDDFTVAEQTEILGIVTSIFTTLNSVLVAIGSISLLVGGIGIMNIMYASVTERIKEIGIKRAIGATKKDILVQFLSEAILLALIGGLLGLMISSLIVLVIRSFFPAAINILSVFLAFSLSSFIGIFFGVFPAVKAANLSPVEAIRYE